MGRASTRDLTGATFPHEPFLRKNPPKGFAVAVVKGIDRNGVAFQIQRKGTTERLAFAAVDEAIRQIREGGSAPRAVQIVKMGELFTRWWDHEEKLAAAVRAGKTTSTALADSSRIKYREIWKRHLSTPLGDRVVTSLTHAEVYEFLHQERGCQPKPLLDVLRKLFGYAESAGLIEPAANPARGRFQLHAPKPAPEPLDVETIAIIEEHLVALKPRGHRRDAARLYDSWVVLRSTGLRLSEALALRARDYDPTTRRLHVSAHVTKQLTDDGEGARFEAVDGSKTAAGDRWIMVPSTAAGILASRCDGRRPEDFLFPTSTGRAIVPESWRNALATEINKINAKREAQELPPLTGIHPHRLRATVASTLVREMVATKGLAAGLEEARQQLGHRGTAVLLHYVTEDSKTGDHSAILDTLDPTVQRLRLAEDLLKQLGALDGFYTLALVARSAGRDVWVDTIFPLSEEQERIARTALEGHEIDFRVG